MFFLPDTFAGSSDCSRCCEGRYLLGAEVVRGDVVVCITRIGCITCCHFRRTMSYHCSPLPRGCTKYGTLRTPHGPKTTHPIVMALHMPIAYAYCWRNLTLTLVLTLVLTMSVVVMITGALAVVIKRPRHLCQFPHSSPCPTFHSDSEQLRVRVVRICRDRPP